MVDLIEECYSIERVLAAVVVVVEVVDFDFDLERVVPSFDCVQLVVPAELDIVDSSVVDGLGLEHYLRGVVAVDFAGEGAVDVAEVDFVVGDFVGALGDVREERVVDIEVDADIVVQSWGDIEEFHWDVDSGSCPVR